MEIRTKMSSITRRLYEFRDNLDYRQEKSGVLMKLFDLITNYDQLSASLLESVDELRRDWIFLHMFVEIIFSSDTAAAEFESVIRKINNVVNDIGKDLSFCDDDEDEIGKYSAKRLGEILAIVGGCQRKTDELRKAEEIGEALEDLSEFAAHSLDTTISESVSNYFPTLMGVFSDAGNVVLNEKASILYNELQMIRTYLYPGKNKDLNVYLSSVDWRVGVECCKFWFKRRHQPQVLVVATAALVDLHKEIDPSNPEFLQLILRSSEKTTESGPTIAFICTYLMGRSRSDPDLLKEVESLITLVTESTLEDQYDGEDVQSFFAEIWAVLREASFTHRKAKREAHNLLHPSYEKLSWDRTPSMPPNPTLLTKLCLLKAELFLKEHLNIHTASTTTLFSVDTKILTSLRAFTKEEGNTEYVKQSLLLIEELANEIDSLCSKGITYPLVNPSLLQLLFKIVFFKAQSFLTHLLLDSSDTSAVNDQKEQIQSLAGDLNYFKTIVMNKVARDSSDETVLIQVEAVARGITLLSYSFLLESDKFPKMIHSLLQLLDKAKVIKAKLTEMNQQLPMPIFPKAFQLGSVDFLGRNISGLLKRDPESIALVKHQIEEVLFHLQSLKSFLVKVNDSDAELQGELKDRIIQVAYKLEYVVDSIEDDGHALKQSIWLYHLLEDIRLLDQHVSQIHVMSNAAEIKPPPRIPSRIVSRDATEEIFGMMVHLDDEEKVIVNRLTRGFGKRDVVSIVGMAGSGKTTLAGKVFNNQNVTCHFHRRAWCTVSETYSKRELLLEILSHTPFLTADISQLDEDDLLLKLRQCLLRNKYLIVMDDVWDTAAWNDLEKCFPDDNNGSRILITSRRWDVASKIKPDSDPHSIRLFSDVESWMLLEKRIFQVEVCPGDLLETGKEIAQHCQGLPLAVVAIAGLLQTIERSKDSWEKVSKSLSSVIINNPENRCKEILELSYTHLPECLKPCFLYFGVFLEDKDIPVSKLMRFWIAEGFIQETDSKSLEEVAEDYLLQLINRSLVNVSRIRSNGKARTCRLHDLLRDLCHLKAKEENFIQLVSSNDKPYSSFTDSDYDVEFDHLAPTTFESYRLSLYLKRLHFIDSRPSGMGVRSLIFFASVDSEPKRPYDISFMCPNFKLLRLLDLEYVMANGFPDEIGLMVQLRYLAVSGYMESIPASIANLWRLETLVVNGFGRKVILPETIWSMERLRHLRVNKHVGFMSIPDLTEQVPSSFILQNLVSFSTPSLSCGEDTLSIFRRLPNLQKLRCIWNSSKDCNGFPALEFLTHLESLKIIYSGPAINSGQFVFPSNLKKLTLSNFCLQGNHLSMIGELPQLRILKLHAGAFEGKTWIMEEEDHFKELAFLELDSMNIAKWDASYDHLPNLERLVVRNCRDLEAIPPDFANIATLKTIEVQWCSQSVVESVEEIQKTTNEIEVLINRF